VGQVGVCSKDVVRVKSQPGGELLMYIISINLSVKEEI